MSKITGIPDFQDFIEKEGIEYLQKIKIYVGFYNYFMDEPVETKTKKELKDWAPFFRYTIASRSLYRNLGGGYIVLTERDYMSEQEDKAKTPEARKRFRKMREANIDYLTSMGFSQKEAAEMSRYKWELEDLIK